jgi:tRNA (guanine-N(7)-)-methyltransferase
MTNRGSLPAGAAFWCELFGRDAPVEIEIGSGDGRFLAGYGARFPERNLFGIERSPAKSRRLAHRLVRLALPNVRMVRADATCVVASLVPRASVTAYHVYFPDPWPKRGHAARRIFTPSFVTGLARTLVPGGRVFLATDVVDYAQVACEHLVAASEFREVASVDDHPGLGTSFARKYCATGRVLHTFTFERAADAQASSASSDAQASAASSDAQASAASSDAQASAASKMRSM